MQVNIASNTIEPLSTHKSAKDCEEVTVKEHFNRFWEFTSVDVWTGEGWLVTAVQDNGTTHHVRKGTQFGTVDLPPDHVLYHAPLSKAQ